MGYHSGWGIIKRRHHEWGILAKSWDSCSGSQGDQLSRVGNLLNRLSRIPATATGLMQAQQGQAEVRGIVMRWAQRSLTQQSLSWSQAVPSTLSHSSHSYCFYELVLHKRLRGGEKGDDLDTSSGQM